MPTAETYDYGSTVTLPAVPTKTGHTGTWDYDGSEITGNLTITAVYVINEYTVTYSAEGIDDLEPMTQKYEYGTVITLMEIPEIEFYTNTLWLCNNTEYASGATVTVESDMNFVVKYTPVKVQLLICLPNYSYGSPPGPYEAISIDYGKAFSKNDRGFTTVTLLKYFDNPYGLYPQHMISSWANYTASKASVLNTYDLTDDFIIDRDVISNGSYSLNTGDETYTGYYVNIYIDYVART